MVLLFIRKRKVLREQRSHCRIIDIWETSMSPKNIRLNYFFVGRHCLWIPPQRYGCTSPHFKSSPLKNLKIMRRLSYLQLTVITPLWENWLKYVPILDFKKRVVIPIVPNPTRFGDCERCRFENKRSDYQHTVGSTSHSKTFEKLALPSFVLS